MAWRQWEVDSRSLDRPRKFWLMRFNDAYTEAQTYVPRGEEKRREWASRTAAQRFADRLNATQHEKEKANGGG